MNCGAGSFKSQLKRADRSGARYAVILGDEELARGVAGLKALREEAGQSAVPLADLAGELSRLVAGRGRGNGKQQGTGRRRPRMTESSKWKT